MSISRWAMTQAVAEIKCSQDNQSKNSIELVWNTYQIEGSYSAAGRKLGISDVAVKKRLKKAGYIK